jgi:hypothetical protein
MKPNQPKLNLSDWQKTDSQELEKVLAIVAPELHSFISEHHELGKLMDRVREGYSEEIYRRALE